MEGWSPNTTHHMAEIRIGLEHGEGEDRLLQQAWKGGPLSLSVLWTCHLADGAPWMCLRHLHLPIPRQPLLVPNPREGLRHGHAGLNP